MWRNRNRFCRYAAALLCLWSLAAPLAGADAPTPPSRAVFESSRFSLTSLPPGAANLEYWADFCEKALDRLRPGGAPPLPGAGKIQALVCMTAKDFEETAGMHAESVSAVALSDRETIVLNVDALRSVSPLEQFQVVGHELVHLLLGRVEKRNARPVPMWLHEGLAQIVSGEIPSGGIIRLAWAGIFNRLIPMNRLTAHFPYGGPDSELAYAQSASFTRYVAAKGYFFSTAGDFFNALLRDTPSSRAMLKDLNDFDTVAMFETRWRRESGALFYWFLALTSGTLLWGGIVVLFLVAYARKRRRERVVMEDWDEWEREE